MGVLSVIVGASAASWVSFWSFLEINFFIFLYYRYILKPSRVDNSFFIKFFIVQAFLSVLLLFSVLISTLNENFFKGGGTDLLRLLIWQNRVISFLKLGP